MPTAKQTQENLLGELVCLMGQAGTGKSALAVQAPQPHAILCVDKPVITMPPDGAHEAWDYDSTLSFGKFYPPPKKDLTNDKELPSRNVFDEIIKDIEAIKIALYRGSDTFQMGSEMWPLPKTIIVEGMDFVRDHCVDWVLHTQSKHHMDEFLTADGRPNVFLGWGLVAAKMDELFKNLAYLPSVRPVNIVITIGIDEETKREKINGKVEVVKTGKFDPAFGGKMSLEAPRKFRDCWLTERVGGQYKVVTAPNVAARYENYRGLRSGRFGLQSIEDVTLDLKKLVNHWNRLFV